MRYLMYSAAMILGVGALAGAATAAPSAGAQFQLDENYAAMEPAAGTALAPGEIDHNVMPGISDDGEIIPEPSAVPMLPRKEAAPAQRPNKAAKAAAKAREVAEPEEIPLIKTQNEASSSPDVSYVTGGIGDDEKQAIQESQADYNLHVMSASTDGAFVGDAHVIITRKNGAEVEEMLNVVAGPLLNVKLPDGTYTLDATLGAQKKHQVFTVTRKGKPANIHLGWKVPAKLSN